MNKVFIAAILILVLAFTMNVVAQDAKYVGVAKCKTCHGKKTGDQYGIWQKGPHANALKSLSSEAALKFAKENGIADPAKDDKCLNCHATIKTIDAKLLDDKHKMTLEEGVSCESCHGPGSEYKSPKIMKKKAYDEDYAAAHKAALDAGLIEPTEKVCLTCHNEKNPFHKEFNYAEQVKKIAHPNPERKK
ncbi:MAG: hypothetical protein JW956_00775 [Calditrichaceae bacterium]|nr:hypothetical protein [Calditrichaceae bacterium]